MRGGVREEAEEVSVLVKGGSDGLEGGVVTAGEVVVLCDEGGLIVLGGVRLSGLVVGWWCFLGAGEVRGGATGV